MLKNQQPLLIQNLPVNAPTGTPANGSTLVIVDGVFFIAVIVATNADISNIPPVSGTNIYPAVSSLSNAGTTFDKGKVYRFNGSTWSIISQ